MCYEGRPRRRDEEICRSIETAGDRAGHRAPRAAHRQQLHLRPRGRRPWIAIAIKPAFDGSNRTQRVADGGEIHVGGTQTVGYARPTDRARVELAEKSARIKTSVDKIRTELHQTLGDRDRAGS